MAVGTRCPTKALPSGCAACAVRNSSLCAVLRPDELWVLNSISLRRDYDAGQIIIGEYEATLCANIVSGMAMEKKSLADGREQIVSLLFPGDFLGQAFADRADATIEAVSPLQLCMFDRSRFAQAAQSHPHLKQALAVHTQRELEEARDWLLLLGQKNALERISTFLTRLADRASSASCSASAPTAFASPMELPLSRAQIAAYLGLTIETVSRKFTALRRSGVIAVDGPRTVRVLDAERLRTISGY